MRKKLHHSVTLKIMLILISFLIIKTEIIAQIAYTEVVPNVDVIWNEWNLDLNNDGIPDFHFNNSIGDWEYELNLLCASDEESIVGYIDINCFNLGFASPLNIDESIGLSQNWLNFGSTGFLFNYYYSCDNLGDWINEGDHYLGLSFKIGNNRHYAWAKLVDGHLLTEYAYNATPNTPILAGQTTLGIENYTNDNLKVVVSDKIIQLFNIYPNSFYKLYDLSGQIVQKNHLDNKVDEIDCTNLSSGLYILELRGNDNGVIDRKKIVID